MDKNEGLSKARAIKDMANTNGWMLLKKWIEERIEYNDLQVHNNISRDRDYHNGGFNELVGVLSKVDREIKTADKE